jgi:hypothetical protein
VLTHAKISLGFESMRPWTPIQWPCPNFWLLDWGKEIGLCIYFLCIDASPWDCFPICKKVRGQRLSAWFPSHLCLCLYYWRMLHPLPAQGSLCLVASHWDTFFPSTAQSSNLIRVKTNNWVLRKGFFLNASG